MQTTEISWLDECCDTDDFCDERGFGVAGAPYLQDSLKALPPQDIAEYYSPVRLDLSGSAKGLTCFCFCLQHIPIILIANSWQLPIEVGSDGVLKHLFPYLTCGFSL